MQRDLEIRARCSPQERDALRALAEQQGLPPTEYLRFVIRDLAREAGLWQSTIKQVEVQRANANA